MIQCQKIKIVNDAKLLLNRQENDVKIESLAIKLERAFFPLFDALEREKQEVPLRKAEDERKKSLAEEISRNVRTKETRKLIKSLK